MKSRIRMDQTEINQRYSWSLHQDRRRDQHKRGWKSSSAAVASSSRRGKKGAKIFLKYENTTGFIIMSPQVFFSSFASFRRMERWKTTCLNHTQLMMIIMCRVQKRRGRKFKQWLNLIQSVGSRDDSLQHHHHHPLHHHMTENRKGREQLEKKLPLENSSMGEN